MKKRQGPDYGAGSQVPVEFCQSAQPGVAILGFRGLGFGG